MDTLRGFVDAVVTTSNSTGQKYWNRPDRMSDSFELRKLMAPPRSLRCTERDVSAQLALPLRADEL